MRFTILLLAFSAFGQQFKPIPLPPPTSTSRGGPVWIHRSEITLGSPGWPWPCEDRRITKAKPGDYRHIYCITKAGVLLMDGKPLKK